MTREHEAKDQELRALGDTRGRLEASVRGLEKEMVRGRLAWDYA